MDTQVVERIRGQKPVKTSHYPRFKKHDPRTLSLTDLVFTNHYLSNGHNATQAYLSVHPKVTTGSAEVLGAKIFGKVSVQAEIRRRLSVQGQKITLESIQEDLLLARSWAMEAKNPDQLERISMSCAKLQGYLIERKEVKTIEDEKANAIRSLVRESLAVMPSN